MSNVVIGIAELDVVKVPNTITTLGLGSCCGVVLYDKVKKIGGMIHIMLPMANAASDSVQKSKFADTGILLLLDKMLRAGANRNALTAKIAGGAHMFSSITSNSKSDLLKVGERNVSSCLSMLMKLRIPVVAKDVFGTYGRTITFDPATGDLHIKTVGKGEKTI